MRYVNGKVYYMGELVKKDFAIVKNRVTFKNIDRCEEEIDLTGIIVSPGFVDVHIHTRVPGFEYKEDIKHVTQALIYGGFTHAVAQSNTNPRPNTVGTFKKVQKLIDESEVNIIQAARITKEEKVVNIKKISKYTRLFTDDGEPVVDDIEMQKAIKSAKETDSTLILHEQDSNIKGQMYHCSLSKENKIAAFNEDYESNIVRRDIKLNENINAKLHFQHLSTKQSIELIKKARKNGMNITAEVTPHHLFFDNEMIINDGKFKMNPPLANPKGRLELIKALKNKHITIIATDHAPHAKEEKQGGFEDSVNGIIGLETSFGVVNTIAKQYKIPLKTIIESMSLNPGQLIGIDTSIKEGKIANLTFLDVNEKWEFKEKDIKSKSSNTPFIGIELIGRVKGIVLNGKYKNFKGEK
ncbi:dihydroorotase [Mycoplasma marinum]|uniref:Amidohydrolase-related domain-containing protein n=1 Tax=Mycoplasma marinum TaxID=1937190 RepID=A0A4R0XLC9_9MOLU|nr:dihydroorotase [Mycoplasma marinum]TCG11476.1 hypothetical protein C4B24_01820 [Mycoplasma marinum]